MLNVLRRLVASANYRLNEKPARLLPAGSDEYVRANSARKMQLATAAEQQLGGIKWTATTDFTGASTTDYLMLYRYIVERKPAYVLELGSGITTLIMAKALAEVGTGRLVSVDHIAHYSEEARRLLTPELAARVDFVVSPAIGEIYGGLSAMRYREIPSHPYDMIFVDGPSTLVGGTDFPSTDALHCIAASQHPADILIDLRVVTVHRYSGWINRPVVFDPILRLGVIHRLDAEHIRGASTSPWDFKSRVVIGDAFEALGLSDPASPPNSP